MKSKHTITIRMGAPHWDAAIQHGDTTLHFDFRSMDRRARSDFHREFMNSFRMMQQQQQEAA